MSRKTIGDNPLDALLATKEEKPKKTHQIQGNDAQQAINNNKQRLTVQISEEIIERSKNAVYWTRGLTLAKLTEEALEKALLSLEETGTVFDEKTGKPMKKQGEAFPHRKEELKRGRPIN